MSSADYLANLERPAVQWVTLVDLAIRQELHGWTSVGSGAYSTPYSPFTHPTTLRADRGLYRGCTGVRENQTDLTVRANLAAVQANAGSYYFDEAAALIYVKTSGGVNPDSLGLMSAWFKVRLATRPMNFAGEPPYDGQIDGNSLPSVQQQRPELLNGITVYPIGDVTFQNADGFWDWPAGAFLWEGGLVTLKVGAVGMALADFETVAAMSIPAPITAGDTNAKIQLRSRTIAGGQAFPQHTRRDWFGALGTDGDSDYLPMFWGYGQGIPLIYVGPNGAGWNKWIMSDPLIGNIAAGLAIDGPSAISLADGSGVALTAPEYSFLGGADGAINIADTYDPEDYELFAFATTNNYRYCGSIAQRILIACGVPVAMIDTAAFAQADIDAPYWLRVYVPGGRDVSSFITGTELLNQIERSTLSSIWQKNDGTWTMKVWNPCIVPSTARLLTDYEARGLAPDESIGAQPITGVTVRYGYLPYSNEWQATGQLTSDRAKARIDSTESITVETLLAFEADALTLRARLLVLRDKAPRAFTGNVGPTFMAASVGDQVWLSRARGVSTTGAVDQVLEIVSLDKRMASMECDLLISDRGTRSKFKASAPVGTPAWASASNAEKNLYGFSCDPTTGLVDPNDPTTFQQWLSW